MCENNSKGSLGIIINKPIFSQNAAEILQQTGLEAIHPSPEIYLGGPVNIQMGLVLHDSNYKVEGTLSVSESIALTSNKQIISDLQLGNGPQKFRFSMGYAGWEKGQLETEIENGDWLIMPADTEFIFSFPDIEKWEIATTKLGIDISDLGGSAGIA